MVKVEIDRKKCIGCGACASVCEEVFEMKEINGEYKAVVKQKTTNSSCVKEAADTCPVQAIKLK